MTDQPSTSTADARVPLLLWAALFLVGVIRPLNGIYVDLALADGIAVREAGTWVGRDFTNLWLGGKLALQGVNVYDNAAYVAGLLEHGITQPQNYSYPPATLLIGAALSQFPYHWALAIWIAGGLTLFVLAARPYIRFHWAWLLLLPMLVTRNGQWGVIAGALFLWSFRGSGVAAGLLTMKPHLGLLLAAAMACKHRVRQIAVAVATCVVLWGAAEAVFGLTRNFLTEGVAVQREILTYPGARAYFSAMPSTFVRLRTFDWAWLAHGAVAAIALGMLWRLRHLPLKALAFPAATATFIVLPYAFHST